MEIIYDYCRNAVHVIWRSAKLLHSATRHLQNYFEMQRSYQTLYKFV